MAHGDLHSDHVFAHDRPDPEFVIIDWENGPEYVSPGIQSTCAVLRPSGNQFSGSPDFNQLDLEARLLSNACNAVIVVVEFLNKFVWEGRKPPPASEMDLNDERCRTDPQGVRLELKSLLSSIELESNSTMSGLVDVMRWLLEPSADKCFQWSKAEALLVDRDLTTPAPRKSLLRRGRSTKLKDQGSMSSEM